MAFEISTGKKKNSQGRVALSLRFRMGKVDQQAKTNLWISPAVMKTEKYITPNKEEDRNKYALDGLHLNNEGHKLLADFIISTGVLQ